MYVSNAAIQNLQSKVRPEELEINFEIDRTKVIKVTFLTNQSTVLEINTADKKIVTVDDRKMDAMESWSSQEPWPIAVRK